VVSVADLFHALAGAFAHQAPHDVLTGLATRDLFFTRLRAACEQTDRQRSVAVLFIDIDRFKQVNDGLGHAVGDQLLCRIATRLESGVRAGDLVARLGGDEFAVLLEHPAGAVPGRDPAAVADRLLRLLREPVDIAGTQLVVTASVGVAVGIAAGGDPDTLLREADLAMYRAKAAGGARTDVVLGVEAALAAPGGVLGVDDTLPRALAAGEFRVHFQPIVDICTGQAASVEALVRWQPPGGALRGPADFLPAAEASGLILDLGQWILTEACRQLRRWDTTLGPLAPAQVNVNVSVRQMLDPDLPARVRAALADSGLAADRLRIELLESATVEQLLQATGPLRELRELGVGLVLDDLGAAASSLRHVTAEIVQGFKIDQSFIAGMLDDHRDLAVVRLLIDLAHALDIAVVAEGVETAEQLAALAGLGCAYAQGFHLCRPAPAETITTWLARRPPIRPPLAGGPVGGSVGRWVGNGEDRPSRRRMFTGWPSETGSAVRGGPSTMT